MDSISILPSSPIAVPSCLVIRSLPAGAPLCTALSMGPLGSPRDPAVQGSPLAIPDRLPLHSASPRFNSNTSAINRPCSATAISCSTRASAAAASRYAQAASRSSRIISRNNEKSVNGGAPPSPPLLGNECSSFLSAVTELIRNQLQPCRAVLTRQLKVAQLMKVASVFV